MVRFLTPHRSKPPRFLTGREMLRIGSLVAALCLVTMLVTMLGRPEAANQLDRVFTFDTTRDRTPSQIDATIPRKGQQRREASLDPDTFRKLLELAGWDANRFAQFTDGQPPTDDERIWLLELLRRLHTIDPADFPSGGSDRSTLTSANEHRGQLTELKGRVTRVERRTLPPDLAQRLELPAYIECDMALDDGAGVATILAAHAPEAWFGMEPLDEPAEARAVFVKSLPAKEHAPAGLFVARNLAWYPQQVRLPHVTFSDVVLGKLGMDVGLLDHIAQRRSILASERTAFYELLAAASRASAEQILRLAQQNLPLVRNAWETETNELRNAVDRQRLQLAEEVVARADQGRYSVAPLFNEPASQVGQLVAIDGLARRAIRVDVGLDADGQPSDVARRFGIDHYYELDVFTDDSQNNPIVFCATELPPGFPTGESIREPVRAAGFFFKSWSFQNRRGTLRDGDAPAVAGRQFAPLVVGRAPIRLESANPQQSAYAGYWFAAGFLAVVAAIWILGWYFARDDRRFADQLIRDQYSLAPGESLNDLDLPHPTASGGTP